MLPPCISSAEAPEWKLNTALVVVSNATTGDVLQSLSDDCTNCTWRSLCALTEEGTATLVDSLYPTQFRVVQDNEILCNVSATLHNAGRYSLDVASCALNTLEEGDGSTLLASLVAIFGLLFLFTAHDFYLHFKSGWWSAQEDHDEYYFGNIPRYRSTRRLLSISVFRGLCVCFMAFANSDGGGLAQFQHSTWNGITVADVIFPAFLFCAGLSSQIAIAHHPSTTIDWPRLLNRMVYLWIIGVFIVNKGSDWRTIRIMGVLQRLALCQLIVFPLQVKVNQPQTHLRVTRRLRRFQTEASIQHPDEYDIIAGEEPLNDPTVEPETDGEYATNYSHYFGEWLQIATVYWFTFFLALLTSIIPAIYAAPGCPKFYLGPGGIGDQGVFANCTGGLVGYVDRQVLGAHIYHDSPVKAVYDSLDIDPEGIMGTFNAAVLVAVGVLAGQILRWYPFRCEQYTRLIVYGTLHLAAGYAMDKAGVPANKQLWSFSFSLITGGYCLYLFCLVRLAVDHVQTKIKLRALAYVGDNALLIYILQEAFSKQLPYEFFVGFSTLPRVLLSLWTVFCSLFLGFFLRHFDIKLKL